MTLKVTLMVHVLGLALSPASSASSGMSVFGLTNFTERDQYWLSVLPKTVFSLEMTVAMWRVPCLSNFRIQ